MTQRFKSVIWHYEPVNIPGVTFSKYNKETAFQIYCVTWLRKRFILTEDMRFAYWHHSPNEGKRSGRDGLEKKLMGMSKGYPDLTHCGLKLAIELKLPKGAVSDDQWAWLAYFKSIGWHAEIVRNFDRFKEIVEAS